MQKNKVVFLTGVSGAGKTTIMNLLLQDNRFQKVCSTTTRAMREGEKDGDQYFFVSFEEFEKLQQADLFVEYACVHGKHRYGTRKDFLNNALASGLYPIKNIDPIGMKIIQDKDTIDFEYCAIFLTIEDDVVKERIMQRQADIDKEELNARIQSASHERDILQDLNCHVVDASKTITEVLESVYAIIFA